MIENFAQVEIAEGFQAMIGRSTAMLDVYDRISRIAPHFRSVLVIGQTGTGKELISRTLHQLSATSSGPFVVCNCPAIVQTLFESELFGHVKGAFTGAFRDRPGFIELAEGGTLFLDEVGDLPQAVQAKLLRALQSGEVQRVGSANVRKISTRIIAATNRDLREAVTRSLFREDLYYRLSMIEVEVPSLVDRHGDLPLLEMHFLRRFAALYGRPVARITAEAQSILMSHSWPGNVRELENVIGQASLLAEVGLIDVQHLPKYLRAAYSGRKAANQPARDTSLLPISELERRHAAEVFERVGRCKIKAAAALGISRSTLYRLLPSEMIRRRAGPRRQQ